MRKHKTTFKTYSQRTKNIARRIASSILTCAAAIVALTAQSQPSVPSVPQLLKRHLAALATLHVSQPSTHEATGTLDGLGLHGIFHEWQDGNDQRRDETLGIRTQRVLRVGNRMWMQSSGGDIRELHGLVARRQTTEDFIDSEAFASHPEAVSYLDRSTLPDGRLVYDLRVAPKNGEEYHVAIDAKTYLIDRKSYIDGDATISSTYNDFRVVNGMLVPFAEIDSNGDTKYDISSHVTKMTVNQPIPQTVFAPLQPLVVQNAAPVTLPMNLQGGLLFAHVKIGGKPYQFLLDTGAQGVVFDPHVARELNLVPQGAVEVRGAERVAAQGLIETPDIDVSGALFPSHVATVVDLSSVSSAEMDGILGFPFFAAAEVRFDPDAHTVTIAKPGTLPPLGTKIAVDTDRQLPELMVSVNQTDGRFVLDTGNSNEVLLFKGFIDKHPGLISFVGHGFVSNRGVGGSTAAVGTTLSDLHIGDYHLYNRYANVILSSVGAFADQNDGGNIGYGVLKNFITTFDLANGAIYLQRARGFDDGRYRPIGG